VVELGVVALALVVVFFAGRAGIGCAAERVATSLPLRIDAEIGRAGAEQMRAKYSAAGEPSQAQRQRVEAIFAELRSHLRADESEVLADPRVTVVRDDQINAFALPGGEVFVLTGLLERVGDGDDAMLRGVIAHELGHAVRRHGIRNLARQAAFAVVIGTLVGDVDELVVTLAAGASELDGLAHSREMESEADAFGLDLLQRAGYDGDGLARFLESLETQPVPELLSTHPDPRARAEAIRDR
jgi:predicted Zn-dependent protease